MLADISGYTSFLQDVTNAHPELTAGVEPVPPAYDFMVTLLDLVADGLQPTFTPVQTEGDALFAVAEAEAVTDRGTRSARHDRVDLCLVPHPHRGAAAYAGPRLHRLRAPARRSS